MKSLLSALTAFAAALTIAACASGGPPDLVTTTPGAPSGATAISEAAQKALYAAEAAYNVPADAYVRLNRQGALSADVKAKAKPMLQQAYRGLKLARQAAAAGDNVGVVFQAGEVQRLATAARAILPAR